MKKLILLISIICISIAGFGQKYTIEESSNSGFFLVNDVEYSQGHYSVIYGGRIDVDTLRRFSLYDIYTNKYIINSRYFDDVTGVTSWNELIELFSSLGALKSNDVAIQDQTTPLIIAKMSLELASTLLSDTAFIDSSSIIVDDITGFESGGYLSVFNISANRFYLGYIISVSNDSVFLDSPLDFAYPEGSFVTSGTTNMNLDGSDTTRIFGLRNTEEQVGSEFDITRILIHSESDAANDLSTFGDIAGGLTYGILLRKVDGEQRNIFNAKTNGELKSLMYDFDIEQATNPVQGQDGFTGRMTFGGQNKMGVVIRLKQGEDLQLVIRDDLSGLQLLEIICEGHLVDY